MKLEDQFFHSFFYPFIVGVILSATMVIISSIVFTCNYIDKGTRINIIELEKNYSKVNLNSINIIITTYLLKIQSGLNELINNYQNLANQIILPENNVTIDIENINDTFFKAAYDLYVNKTFSEEIKNISELMALWFLDKKTNLNDTKNNIELRRQLKCFSTMMSNIYSTFTSINSTSSNFYFIFDKTELFVAFPLDYFFSINLLMMLWILDHIILYGVQIMKVMFIPHINLNVEDIIIIFKNQKLIYLIIIMIKILIKQYLLQIYIINQEQMMWYLLYV